MDVTGTVSNWPALGFDGFAGLPGVCGANGYAGGSRLVLPSAWDLQPTFPEGRQAVGAEEQLVK